MPSSAINKVNDFSVGFTLTSDQVINLVLYYLHRHPKVKYEELNLTYIRNITKDCLKQDGLSVLQRIPPEVLLRKQDLLMHIRGMVIL